MKKIYNVCSLILIFCASTAIHGMKNDMAVIKPVKEFHFFTGLSDDIQNHIFEYGLPNSFDSQDDLRSIAKRVEVLQLVWKKNIELCSLNKIASLLNITDTNKDFFLLCAAHRGALCFMQLAVNRNANLDFVNKDCWPYSDTPLSIAVRNNYPQSCCYLLQAGADVALPIKIYDESWLLPLYIAVLEKNVKIAKLLIGYKADVNQHGRYFHNGDTYLNPKLPIEKAIENQDAAMVKLLLDNGANVPDICYQRRAAIFLASLATEQDGQIS